MDAKLCLTCPHAPKKVHKWCKFFDEMPRVPLCPHHPGVLAEMKRRAEIAAAIVLDNDVTQQERGVRTPHLDRLGVKRDDPLVSEVCVELNRLVAQRLNPHDIFKEEIKRVREAAERQNAAIDGKNQVGRNDPCTCGSGKKYKKCCLH
ncbi:SEC-C domain-containing protein [Patescibacteria group bacterium]|nr:SEC-C domain-containing protein [Patescibacteria group bacterium]